MYRTNFIGYLGGSFACAVPSRALTRCTVGSPTARVSVADV